MGWEVINFTGSTRNSLSYDDLQPVSNKNSHDVIGQEFDRVAVFIDPHFYYNSEKKLEANHVLGGYYSMQKMLYQNVTRAREELQLIIVNNPQLLSVTLDILNSRVPVLS